MSSPSSHVISFTITFSICNSFLKCELTMYKFASLDWLVAYFVIVCLCLILFKQNDSKQSNFASFINNLHIQFADRFELQCDIHIVVTNFESLK